MIHRNNEQLALDEVVFANKNQMYGAYQLRQSYNSNLKRAVAIMLISLGGLGLALKIGQRIFSYHFLDKIQTQIPLNEVVIDLTSIKSIPTISTPIQQNITPKTPIPIITTPINNTNYRAVEVIDEQIKNDHIVENNLPVISNNTSDTQSNTGEISSTNITEIVTNKEATVDPVLYAPIMPKFDDLSKYLAENTKFPSDMIQAGISGKVYISFVINQKGEVKEAKVAKSSGYISLDNEALRVISKMPNWTPGQSNENPVAVRQIQCINFKLQE